MSTANADAILGRSKPWRENIEALAAAIILALFLKVYILEAYKIPSGSMQPTLFGSADPEIFDRILVNKFTPKYRDPERFEVVVFKYPLNRAQNFVKRVVGMPGEQLRILNAICGRARTRVLPGASSAGPPPCRRPTGSAWIASSPTRPAGRSSTVATAGP